MNRLPKHKKRLGKQKRFPERFSKAPLRKGKSPKRCQQQKKRGDFEEVPRLAAMTVAGNRLARRWAGWHGEAVTGGFFPARTRRKRAAVYPARNPSTNLRLVPLPLGKGGNGFQGVRWCGAMWASPPTEPYREPMRRGRCLHRPARRIACNLSLQGRCAHWLRQSVSF